VPEKRSGKRSRLHLDLYTDSQKEEVVRLLAAGAKPYPWRYPPNADVSPVMPLINVSLKFKEKRTRSTLSERVVPGGYGAAGQAVVSTAVFTPALSWR